MSPVLAIAAALIAAPQPECGQTDLPRIDQAPYELVNGMTASAGATGGEPSTRFFAEPLATALAGEYRRWARGETARLSRDWLSAGGPMNAVTDVRVHYLNRSGVVDADMGLGFINAEGETVYRRLKLGCHAGRWKIDGVYLFPEEVFVSDLLAPVP